MYEIYIITAYAISIILSVSLTAYSYKKYKNSQKNLENIKNEK